MSISRFVLALSIVLRQFLSFFIRQGPDIRLPSWTPPDMPLPYSAQNRSGVLIIPCPEPAFFTMIHCYSPFKCSTFFRP